MRTRHTISIISTCPVNGDEDRYHCRIYPREGELLYCEAIEEAVAQLTARPITQEDLTQRLADMLGARVRTAGTHCRGRVATVCICSPKGPRLYQEA